MVLTRSVPFLDAASFFGDVSRDNDLAYYVVGGATAAKLQGRPHRSLDALSVLPMHLNKNGCFKHCVPREMVSAGEKTDFAALLGSLSVLVAQEARAKGSNADALVGASLYMKKDTGDSLNLQMIAAASQSPDFLHVEGVASAADVQQIRQVLDQNMPRMVPLSDSDTRGFPIEGEVAAGFNIPVVVSCDASLAASDVDQIAALIKEDARIIDGRSVIDVQPAMEK